MVTGKLPEDALDALRSVEVYGYQVACYLLDNERLAVEVVSEALVQLGSADAFFSADADARKEAMKRAVMRTFLAIRSTGRFNASSL